MPSKPVSADSDSRDGFSVIVMVRCGDKGGLESVQEAGWNSAALVLVLVPFRRVVPRRGISYPAPPFPALRSRPGRGPKGCVYECRPF